MRTRLARMSLLWKMLLSTSAAITAVVAVTGLIVVQSAIRATSDSIDHEVQASFQTYQSLWKARADRLSSISSILSAMSDVRAAFSTGDEATIRDTAKELWSRVSDEDAIFRGCKKDCVNGHRTKENRRSDGNRSGTCRQAARRLQEA